MKHGPGFGVTSAAVVGYVYGPRARKVESFKHRRMARGVRKGRRRPQAARCRGRGGINSKNLVLS
jgi:hypothetical protein